MDIANVKEARDFVRSRPEAHSAVSRWIEVVSAAKWRHPNDAIAGYPGTRHLGRRRLNFKLGGNKYRLIAEVDYKAGTVRIRFIGTHTEYESINVMEV